MSSQVDPCPVVTTKRGQIEGTYDGLSRNGQRFYQFRGIQYAVVQERFKPSVEVEPWEGIKPAKEFGHSCAEIGTHGNENCLYLNIFTPQLTTPTLPVAVYIHGGSFQTNCGDYYGPNYLIDEGLILITINYRLGILGFLSTQDAASPGNYGLKDQVMALKWIRDNISSFGGDPDKVTLMGQSAGSASVTYHLASQMSKGLFRHAIAMSGTFLDPWSFSRKPLRHARKLAEHFGCQDTSSTGALVEFLRSVPAKEIGERMLGRRLTSKFFEDPIAAFGPCLEPEVGEGEFLTQSPYDLLTSGKMASKVPLLTGVAREEGVYIWASFLMYSSVDYAVDSRKKMQENFNGVAPAAFYFDEKAPREDLEGISDKLQKFYFGGEGFKLEDEGTFRKLTDLYTDRMFVGSGVRFMNLYSKLAPTFPYLYTFDKFPGIELKMNWGKDFQEKYSFGATHGSELDMLVSPLFKITRIDPVHDQVSKSITKLWASFIKEGVPSATYGSEQNFPAIKPEEGLQKFYKLDTDTELTGNIFAERIAFWESLQLSDNDFENCYC